MPRRDDPEGRQTRLWLPKGHVPPQEPLPDGGELIDLGVLIQEDPRLVRTTTPLFTVEKPGQIGQWRVIADMLQGGQNLVTIFDRDAPLFDAIAESIWRLERTVPNRNGHSYTILTVPDVVAALDFRFEAVLISVRGSNAILLLQGCYYQDGL